MALPLTANSISVPVTPNSFAAVRFLTFKPNLQRSTRLFRVSAFPRECVFGRGFAAAAVFSSSASASKTENDLVPDKSVSVILLAGGKGKRMGAPMPKQYLPLLGQPIVLYSFHTLSSIPEVKEIVVVCDPSYHELFKGASKNVIPLMKFASPGKERQDSVFNGLQEVDGRTDLVCVHDSARPLVSFEEVKKDNCDLYAANCKPYQQATPPSSSLILVIQDAWIHGAAVLGVPVKATIKEANSDGFVVKTLNRETLWEMQTPQVMRKSLLRDGFQIVKRDGLLVTDDVSIVEHLKHPVFITEGQYTNIKVTTPDDMITAETILKNR